MSGNYNPAPYNQTPPPKSPWSSPVVIGAIVAGALVLALAVLVGFLLIASADDNTAAPSTTTPTQQTSTKTITMTPSTAVPTSTLTPTTTRPNLPDPGVPGADGQGFLSGPRCNATEDPAVMIGQTARSNIVVCQVGNQTGRYYYKGLADGNAIEIQFPARSGNRFTAVNNGTTYVVDPSSLTISKNGAVLSSEPMIYYWTD